jgi:hypothetical protein
MSKHADIRMQQRSIPKIVREWLSDFGEESYDKRGCVILYFSKKSRKLMEKTFGKQFVQQNKKYLTVYEVIGSSGNLVTMGWRTQPLRRF